MNKAFIKPLTVFICVIMLFSLSSIAFADAGEAESLKITSKTEDCTLQVGEDLTLMVGVSEAVGSYKWEVSTDGGTSWTQVGTAATFDITNAAENTPANVPYQYRVTVTKASGESGSLTDSAIIRVLVSNDYAYRTIELRGGDVKVAGYMYDETRLEVTPLADDAPAATVLGNELAEDCLPLVLYDVSLVNQNNEVVPYFGTVDVKFHVGSQYDTMKLRAFHLHDSTVTVYSDKVTDGDLTITVTGLSPFMVEVPAADTRTVTVNTGAGGSVTPSGTVNVAGGSDKTFTLLPDAGYEISAVTVDGLPLEITGNSFTLSDITEDKTAFVSFQPVTPSETLHTVTINAPAHGLVYPSGEIQVRHGSAQTIYFYPEVTPNRYELDKVLVNGDEVNVIGSSYTLSAVTGETTVVVSFTEGTSQLPDVYRTIYTSTGANGSISPMGDVRVEYGGDMYFYFIPNSGYEVDKVFVDSVATAVSGNCYHLSDVTDDRTIRVTFKERRSPTYAIPTYNVAVSSGENRMNASATVSGSTASLTVSDSKIDALLDSSAAGSIRIDAGLGKNVDAVRIPVAVVDKIAKAAIDTDSGVTGLSVITDTGEVELDEKALTALSEQATGGNVTICVERVAQTGLNESQRKALAGDHADADVVQVAVNSGDDVISSYNGGKITVTVAHALKEGVVSSGVRVWYLDADGTLELMECSYNEAEKTVSFVTNHLSDFIVDYDEIAAWVNPFADVNKADWFYEDVAYASIAGLMKGSSARSFAPDAFASRAMIVTILWRLENEPEMGAGKSGSFTDVPENEWYTEAVEWAAASGIAEGFGDGTFRPSADISREQLAAILWRYAKYKKYDVSVGEDTNILSYADAESISEYAIPAMQWACGAALIQGDAEKLMPNSSATRAQLAAVMHRFSEQK